MAVCIQYDVSALQSWFGLKRTIYRKNLGSNAGGRAKEGRLEDDQGAEHTKGSTEERDWELRGRDLSRRGGSLAQKWVTWGLEEMWGVGKQVWTLPHSGRHILYSEWTQELGPVAICARPFLILQLTWGIAEMNGTMGVSKTLLGLRFMAIHQLV